MFDLRRKAARRREDSVELQRPEGELYDVESSMTQPLCCKSIRILCCMILRQVGNEDNLLKYNEVNCVNKKWCGMPLIETLEVEHRSH